EVSHLPPILEYVEDPEAYPLKGYRIVVKVDAESNGRLKVPSLDELNSIQFSFTGKRSHAFTFMDTLSKRYVKGSVDNVSYVAQDGPTVIRFTSSDMEVDHITT